MLVWMFASINDGGEILARGVMQERRHPKPSLQEAEAPAAREALELGWPHVELIHKAKCVLTKSSASWFLSSSVRALCEYEFSPTSSLSVLEYLILV